MSAGGFGPGRAIARAGNAYIGQAAVRPHIRRSPAGREEIPCGWHCMECGWYELPDGPLGYRGTRQRPGACPGCGEHAWGDLAENVVVDTLVETDDRRWETRTWRRRAVVRLGALAVGIAAAVSTALARPGDGSYILFGPLLLVIVATIVRGALSDLRAGGRAPHPTRWRRAARAPGRTVERYEGVPTGVPEDGLLMAPLSGRPCVAYELAVRRDSRTDTAPWSWALIEQAFAPMQVNGHTINPEQTRLALPRTSCPDTLDRLTTRTALRMRGLDISRGAYQLFETIIPPTDAIKLEVDRAGRARLLPV